MIRTRTLWFLAAFALLLRLATLGAYPLMDTTEARYGEMARIMVETGNWLTPQFDYGVPFWGKPPLHTWMSAGTMAVLGDNEFAARVPHWIAGLLTLGLVVSLARRQRINPALTALVLASCAIFAVAAGAVMTDMALTLGLTLAMMGFFLGWLGHYRWGYVAFVGLAIGLLAKGPVVIVLMALAVGPWLMMQHGFKGAFVALWQRFPLLSGTLLMLAVAAPWYGLAEQATPGFLNYFLVGEHFSRFVESGWQGDLYGSAHDEPRGTIWLFWLYSALPWSLLLPWVVWRRRGQLGPIDRPWVSFLLLWMVAPMVLFTLAGNILPAYVLPGIPAMALLIATLVREREVPVVAGASLVTPLLLVVAMVALTGFGLSEKKSDKALLTELPEAPLYYWQKRPFSGQFYSGGQARLARSLSELPTQGTFYLAGRPGSLAQPLESASYQCQPQRQSGKRVLYRCEATQ
ncbi:ArnT family glycosyltransferase [Ferrimonas balearica]|uniref:ArnT family glycosyltransferase n=1 Tax=Ferrimonas balearica TaxID=44012 RepID=UPI001C9950D8|nr:glycosyltransferase family 39 protein [Ferrimonas balearica]MBY5921909.1 glycosyltransferase family 39 protein [Ferrimonas balearica]MBY5994751.1 glycosyltransferase family 39 protein [Ferrimonas balearica]